MATSIFLLEVQTSEGAHHSQCLKRLSADLIEVVWQRITLTSGGEPSSESRANSMRTRDLFGKNPPVAMHSRRLGRGWSAGGKKNREICGWVRASRSHLGSSHVANLLSFFGGAWV